jgi:zinc protease
MAASHTTVPEPLAPVPFNLPTPFRSELANGLKVVLFEDSRVPLVNYRLAFLRGDANDPNGATGLTSAVASLLTEGTEKYSSRELAEKIERLGGSLGASASNDFTILSASALSIYSEEIPTLMAEVLFRPIFPEAELDLYKRNALENLKFQRSQPSFLALEQTARLLYGDHPYATVSPKAADYEKLDRETLVRFHASAFQPNNAVLIVVGDVERPKLMEQVAELFADWPRHEFTPATFSDINGREARTLTIVDRPASAQANIVLANAAIPRNHPDHFAATVMNQVLGSRGIVARVYESSRGERIHLRCVHAT